jgi:hypothetical protein
MRMVLVGAAMAAACLGGVARGDEASALKAVEKLGGKVRYEGGGGKVIGVYLKGTQVTDAGLKELKDLKQLNFLDLSGTQVTDAGLKELKDLKQLHFLDLRGTKVTDTGLKELKGLTQLRVLRLGGFGLVTDAGLKELKGLKQLEELHLNATKVTDAGLKELKGLTQLEELRLGFTRVTGVGVADLKKALPKCKIIGPVR